MPKILTFSNLAVLRQKKPKEFAMDLYKFHILLGLLPKQITDSLMMWLLNMHIIPKLEVGLQATAYQRKFAFLLNFDEQVKELYDLTLQTYIETSNTLRI
jgi:hypothetical protein